MDPQKFVDWNGLITENTTVLKPFNEKHPSKKYEYVVLIKGDDMRQVDVGVINKKTWKSGV